MDRQHSTSSPWKSSLHVYVTTTCRCCRVAAFSFVSTTLCLRVTHGCRAVRADGRPADIVALASNTDMVNLTQQAIGEELKDRQEGLSFSWITDRTFYLNVGPQVPLRNILHVAWE